jgi:hypothetical protein
MVSNGFGVLGLHGFSLSVSSKRVDAATSYVLNAAGHNQSLGRSFAAVILVCYSAWKKSRKRLWLSTRAKSAHVVRPTCLRPPSEGAAKRVSAPTGLPLIDDGSIRGANVSCEIMLREVSTGFDAA